MLFLALPPADMLPPAGHRARPGRSQGPHRPLRTARRAPRTLSRALVQQQARPRLPYKVAPTPPPPPPPPRPEQPAPRRGPGTGRLGWHRPGKSVRAKSWPGVAGATRPESGPVPSEEPQEHHIPDSHASDSASNLGCPEHPVPPQVQWRMYICIHTRARNVKLGSEGGGDWTETWAGRSGRTKVCWHPSVRSKSSLSLLPTEGHLRLIKYITFISLRLPCAFQTHI